MNSNTRVRLGIVLMIFLCGCSVHQEHALRGIRRSGFISYSPPPENSRGPRIAVKDLIDVQGDVTTAGSKYLAHHSPPAQRDAACLAQVRARGLPIVGKTNLTEFAVAVSGINPYFGTPRNPLTKRGNLIPGGSSSGSAVVVANGRADVAIGTDTAGSIRVPAACCGVSGLKTTFGLIPLRGVYPIAPNDLDTVGPIARDVNGLAQGMDLLSPGFASRYRRAQAAAPGAHRIRVGRLYVSGTDASVDRAVDDALRKAGFDIVPLGRFFQSAWEDAQRDGRIVAAASAWIEDSKFQSLPGINSRTKAVVALGRLEYPGSYRAALQRRAYWQNVMKKTLRRVDLIALPTLKSTPPKVPLFGGTPAFEARVLGLQNTQAVNFSGNPALAIPIPMSGAKLPVTSLQLIGRPRAEAELLNAGRLIEAKLAPETRAALAAAKKQ